MKNAKKITTVLASLLAISALTSCAKQEEFSLDYGTSGITEPIKTKAPAKGGTSDTDEEIRKFIFNSAEDVEAISDEDLIYIATHYSAVLDQISNGTEMEIDLFGVPLAEKAVDGKTYREDVGTYALQCELPFEEINVNEPFPDEILREYIDEHCKSLISSQNSWDGVTGTRTKDDEIIYCGENDLYIEYSIHFTEVRSQYENNKYVTHEIPRAYRRCFFKNELFVDFGNRASPVYFGELTMDWVKSQPGRSLYKEYSETEDDYICTYYHIYTSGGDFGLCDSATLEKSVILYDKKTHEYKEGEWAYIKTIDIPGTYHEPPDI